MRNDVLKLLRDQGSTQNKVLYNALLKAYSETATTKQVYHYQTGYTPGKLEGLIYDVKKHFFITDKEVVLFEEEEDLPPGVIITGDEGKTDAEILQELEAKETLKKKNDLLAALKINDNPDVIEGMKFRNEYPFLDNPNTPDELKSLVTDKISAYRRYAAVVADILKAESIEDSEAKLYELGKEALSEYEINQDIKAELDFYRDSEGRILGKHEKLKDLRMKQDVYDMSEADLVKNRSNAMKNVSKNRTSGKNELADHWKKRQDVIEERLIKEFNQTFTADK